VETHPLGQRALAEALGTAVLVLVGPGSAVATLVLAGDTQPAVTGADLLGIAFAFGLVIAALVYALGKVSGCHINPAVTLALVATRRFPAREVPAYLAAQLVGAVVGALGIWAVFGGLAPDLGLGQAATDQDTFTVLQAMLAEALGTAILVFAILGIVDTRSPNDFAGLIIGFVVIAIIMVIGPITGAAINPAREFGPVLVNALAGGNPEWGQLVPVYVVAPVLGAVAAAFLYDAIATPRIVVQPIERAVTSPDRDLDPRATSRG